MTDPAVASCLFCYKKKNNNSGGCEGNDNIIRLDGRTESEVEVGALEMPQANKRRERERGQFEGASAPPTSKCRERAKESPNLERGGKRATSMCSLQRRLRLRREREGGKGERGIA